MLTMTKDVSRIGGQNPIARRNQREDLRDEIREIRTIFGRQHISSNSRHTQNIYTKEAHTVPVSMVNHMEERPYKADKRECEDITFTEGDAYCVHSPHYDALVVITKEGNNNIHRILVDNESAADILYLNAYNRMGLTQEYSWPIMTPLYGFIGDSMKSRGNISLPITVGKYPEFQQ